MTGANDLVITVKFHIRYLWDLIYTHTELNLTFHAMIFYPNDKMKTEFVEKEIRRGKHFRIIKTVSLISDSYWFTLHRLSIFDKILNLGSLCINEIETFYDDSPNKANDAMDKLENHYNKKRGKK